MIMDNKINKNSSRKKFLILGLSAITFFSVFKFVRPSQKKKKVKLLTQDGRLVEIDKNLLSKGKKISNEELQQWIKNKSAQH